MKRSPLYLVFALAAAALLSSCSGVPNQNRCTVNCGGNAKLTLTMSDTPPSGVSFLSFNVPIRAISLTPQSGADVSLFAPTTPAVLDMIRLQSDTAVLGTFQVPAGTFTKINFTLDVVDTVFANTSSSTIGSCAANTVCNLNSGTPPTQSITFTSPLVVSSGTNLGLAIDFNLNNLVTAQNGITLDFNQTNILTAAKAAITSGTVGTIEDFTGIITTLSGSNVTITSGTRGAITGVVTSSTTYTGLSATPAVCNNATPSSTCLGVNKTVSVDATVSASGVVTITEVDFLDDPFTNEIEGVIYPTTTPGAYEMIVADKINATSNALLTPVSAGARISVTLDSSATFAVDARNLLASIPNGFTSASDIFPGQTVLIHVKNATTGSLLSILTDRVVLRYSRLTGTVNTVGGNGFTVQNLPPFLGNFSVAPQVQTITGITVFENVADLASLTNGNTVSFRALYIPHNLTETFIAAKVRKH